MTGIEWTDQTWNPATGCSKVSSGCKNCYAEVMAKRLHANGTKKYANGFTYTEHEGAVEAPLRWKKPRRVFVNSMSDFFHEDATAGFQRRCLATMERCPEHQFQILTKRPRAAAAFVRAWLGDTARPWPRNVWLGTSVESAAVLHRITELDVPHVPVRFVSFEPLLGLIHQGDLARAGLVGYQWAIVGGESGPGHRPMELDWALNIRDACIEFGVKFFFKQWGGNTPKSGGRILDGRTWDEMPAGPPGQPLAEVLK